MRCCQLSRILSNDRSSVDVESWLIWFPVLGGISYMVADEAFERRSMLTRDAIETIPHARTIC